MVYVNIKAATKVPMYGYYSAGGGPIVPGKDPLPAYTAFDIIQIIRLIQPGYNKVWVQSGLGHWYQYEEGRFQTRGTQYCDTEGPIHISPAGPSWLPDWNGTPSSNRKPHPGSMYGLWRNGGCGSGVRWSVPYV